MMMRLCAEVVRRAALMIAINISTPVLKSGSGRNPLHPVCITVDGSTYYKTPGLRSLVEEDLRRILGRRGIHFEVLQVDEAPLIGAAVAGLTV
jgi:hexokinase